MSNACVPMCKNRSEWNTKSSVTAHLVTLRIKILIFGHHGYKLNSFMTLFNLQQTSCWLFLD